MITAHFNKLTAAEDERLAVLLEECGEVIQVIGKIQRHGYESCHPKKPTGPTNRQELEKELGDVACAMDLLMDVMDVRRREVARHADRKRRRIKKYLHHQAA